MQIEASRSNDANAVITATIKQSEILAKIEKIAKGLTKTANIDGFRKGKVPVSAIKKQYSERLVKDAEAEALREALSSGLANLNIDNDSVIGEPNISKFDKSNDKIDVEVKIALRPSFELGDYQSLIPALEKPKTSKKEVDSRIIEMAKAQSPFVAVEEDREVTDGDMTAIDFDGEVEGKPLEGGKAENFSLSIGSGQFIPGFEEQIIGMKRGDEKSIEVTFPENYQNSDIAGKPATFKVKLNEIQTKEDVEINRETAQKLLPNEEKPTIKMLRDNISEQIQNEKLSKQYNEEVKPELLNTFIDKYTFDLPEFIVEQELDISLNNRARQMSEEEINELQNSEEKLKSMRKELRPEAEKSVRATFIIDALALAENVSVSEDEVMQTIYYEAMQMGQDPSKSFEQYKEAGYLPAVQMAMVEDRVLGKLLDEKMNKPEEIKTSKEEE